MGFPLSGRAASRPGSSSRPDTARYPDLAVPGDASPERRPLPSVLRTPEALRRVGRRATLARSFGLLDHFKYEQTDPDRFYGLLAEDSVQLIGDVWAGAHDVTGGTAGGLTLADTTVLDVGGGPGYFSRAFADAGARYVSCEPDVGEMAAAGITVESSVRGSGMDLPFATGSVDICYSSNVAEHVPGPWRMADEMLRVTRPGGLVLLSYTLWYGPFGGHEMGLTHYFGGRRAARKYREKTGHRPKNLYGESLFEVGCAEGLRWAQRASGFPTGDPLAADLLGAFPRYHPRWAWWMVRVPGLREAAVSNLVLVLLKR